MNKRMKLRDRKFFFALRSTMKDLMSRTMKDLATTPKWHLESRLKENLSEWIYLIQEVLENRGKYSKDSKSAKVHEILDEFEKMVIKLLPNNNIVGNSLCRPYDLAGGLMYGGDRMKKIIEEKWQMLEDKNPRPNTKKLVQQSLFVERPSK